MVVNARLSCACASLAVLLAIPGCARSSEAFDAPLCPTQILAALSGDDLECSLLETGLIDASGEAHDLAFALYRISDLGGETSIYDAPPYYQTGIALYTDGKQEMIFSGATYIGLSWFEAPYLAANPDAGQLLIIREKYSGTAAGVADVVLIPVENGKWRRLKPIQDPENGEGVVKELQPYMPEGTQIWKGVYINYETLAGETSLWAEGDANCCPSGGRLKFKLGLSQAGDALVVTGAEYVPPQAEDDQ